MKTMFRHITRAEPIAQESSVKKERESTSLNCEEPSSHQMANVSSFMVVNRKWVWRKVINSTCKTTISPILKMSKNLAGSLEALANSITFYVTTDTLTLPVSGFRSFSIQSHTATHVLFYTHIVYKPVLGTI